MIPGDYGEGIQLQAVNPISLSANPYSGVLPDEDYVYLENIPVESFRVLKLGE